MPNPKQTDRLMQFKGPQKDALIIESLEGAEGISRLFEFHVELLAALDVTIDPKSIVGAKAAVSIGLNDAQGARWFNGIVSSFEQGAGDEDFNTYRATIVPGMWQLTLTTQSRAGKFQNMTVVDIVKTVLQEYGLSVSDGTTASYPQHEYCVQYNETDFHFVSRLMEEAGIFYWFEHTESDNVIHLGDDRSAYQDCPLSATIQYAANLKGAEGSYGSWVTEFQSTATMVTGKHGTADYNFRDYATYADGPSASASDYGKNGFEQNIYPSGEEGYLKDTDTSSVDKFQPLFLKAQLGASDAIAEVFSGDSSARSLTPGYAFTLQKHGRDAWNQRYLLTGVVHTAGQTPPYRTSSGVREGYENHFTAVAASIVYRPQRTFRKPRVYGPQTAKVVVSSGEDIWLDKYGRVNLQFLWGEQRSAPDNTWVRVAQHWAGNGWGTYFWPRKGDEVVVEFLNGDPDNPIVVGSVYNGVNMPKYKLPDMSTRSGVVTRSSKGGGAANANELRFEDKAGSEQIFLNAEMDMDHRVENDHRMYVGNKDSLIVQKDRMEQIGGDSHTNLQQNSIVSVGANSDVAVGANLTESVGGNHSENISGNHAHKVGMNYALDAGMQAYLKGGMTVVIESGLELCLKGAGGFITIGPAGVAISGTMVMINSGGAAVSGSPGENQSPKSPTKPDTADDGSKGGAMS